METTMSDKRNELTLRAPDGRVYMGTPEGWQRIGSTVNDITLQLRATGEAFARAAAPIMQTATIRVQMAARTHHRFGLMIGWPPAQRRQVMDMREWSRRKGRRK
jgi:hypothetical protein